MPQGNYIDGDVRAGPDGRIMFYPLDGRLRTYTIEEYRKGVPQMELQALNTGQQQTVMPPTPPPQQLQMSQEQLQSTADQVTRMLSAVRR